MMIALHLLDPGYPGLSTHSHAIFWYCQIQYHHNLEIDKRSVTHAGQMFRLSNDFRTFAQTFNPDSSHLITEYIYLWNPVNEHAWCMMCATVLVHGTHFYAQHVSSCGQLPSRRGLATSWRDGFQGLGGVAGCGPFSWRSSRGAAWSRDVGSRCVAGFVNVKSKFRNPSDISGTFTEFGNPFGFLSFKTCSILFQISLFLQFFGEIIFSWARPSPVGNFWRRKASPNSTWCLRLGPLQGPTHGPGGSVPQDCPLVMCVWNISTAKMFLFQKLSVWMRFGIAFCSWYSDILKSFLVKFQSILWWFLFPWLQRREVIAWLDSPVTVVPWEEFHWNLRMFDDSLVKFAGQVKIDHLPS